MSSPADSLRTGDALLLVDVQNDFCPGGALAIAGGDEVVPVLNDWIDVAVAQGLPVYATRDWHPAGHLSFSEAGGPWPPHCVQDTPGAQYHPELRLPAGTVSVIKGTRFDQDQYSAFDQTGLAQRLRADGVKRLWIGGLALDVCVRASALDALKAGFAVALIPGASRPVSAEAGAATMRELEAAGVQV